MYRPLSIDPIDYLVIGHITLDKIHGELRLGGTATYASLMAQALGMRVGIVTSWGSEISLSFLKDVPIINIASERSTTFENVYTAEGRVQIISNVAQKLDINLVPDAWLDTPIVHLAPVAQEVEPTIVRHFPDSFIGITPQGWLRSWNDEGRVIACEWPEATFVLQQAGATVISIEDIGGNEERIEEMASACRVLAVTENREGVRLFWNGDVRRFRPAEITALDPTGAGDIFAAAFFLRMNTTRDPWESARFANQLAAISVTRPGLFGIPRPDEIQSCMVEVL
jgi:sugar/nucleoside kinase (ribokinase family)